MISKKRVTHAIGPGTTLEADKKASGIAKIEPMIVPRKAIAIVSTNRYGTPSKENSNSKSGLIIPVKIPEAIFQPLSSKLSKLIADNDQINKSMIIEVTTMIYRLLVGDALSC